ncbi:MAG: hypothetical protein JWM32_799 [Verrucomicrobia bacterium]|nr:hypothetical protein [Verrucomicrobiota bacterium]
MIQVSPESVPPGSREAFTSEWTRIATNQNQGGRVQGAEPEAGSRPFAVKICVSTAHGQFSSLAAPFYSDFSTMGKIKLLVLFLATAALGFCADVEIGMKEKDVLEYMGKPNSTASMGEKTIYRWPDMIVTVKNGTVISVKARDLVAERVEEERRLRVVEETRAKEAAWLAAHPPAPAPDAPVTSPPPKTQVQIAADRTARAKKILELRQAIESQRDVVNNYSAAFSSPNRQGTTAPQRDLAQALIAQYEAEIQAIEQAPY